MSVWSICVVSLPRPSSPAPSFQATLLYLPSFHLTGFLRDLGVQEVGKGHEGHAVLMPCECTLLNRSRSSCKLCSHLLIHSSVGRCSAKLLLLLLAVKHLLCHPVTRNHLEHCPHVSLPDLLTHFWRHSRWLNLSSDLFLPLLPHTGALLASVSGISRFLQVQVINPLPSPQSRGSIFVCFFTRGFVELGWPYQGGDTLFEITPEVRETSKPSRHSQDVIPPGYKLSSVSRLSSCQFNDSFT